MLIPDDPLRPAEPAFEAAWQAEALALADSLVKAGVFSPSEWSACLGARLRKAKAAGAPDTLETYYNAVLEAVEALSAEHGDISPADQAKRRAEWEAAYLRTPHGKPVTL